MEFGESTHGEFHRHGATEPLRLGGQGSLGRTPMPACQDRTVEEQVGDQLSHQHTRDSTEDGEPAPDAEDPNHEVDALGGADFPYQVSQHISSGVTIEAPAGVPLLSRLVAEIAHREADIEPNGFGQARHDRGAHQSSTQA